MYRLNCIGDCGWFLEAPTPEQCIAEWQKRSPPHQEAPAPVRAVVQTTPPEGFDKWFDEYGCGETTRDVARLAWNAAFRRTKVDDTRRVASGEEADYVLVPKVPTSAMVDAGREAMSPEKFVSHARAIWTWQAMVKASPTRAQAANAGEPVVFVSTVGLDCVLHHGASCLDAYKPGSTIAKSGHPSVTPLYAAPPGDRGQAASAGEPEEKQHGPDA
jgi:hypothetical protein